MLLLLAIACAEIKGDGTPDSGDSGYLWRDTSIAPTDDSATPDDSAPADTHETGDTGPHDTGGPDLAALDVYPASMIVHPALGAPSGPAPTRKRAASSIGFWVADRPIRSRPSPHSAARRSSDSARWVPRLFGASAWISSTITVRVVASIPRPDSEPSRM